MHTYMITIYIVVFLGNSEMYIWSAFQKCRGEWNVMGGER